MKFYQQIFNSSLFIWITRGSSYIGSIDPVVLQLASLEEKIQILQKSNDSLRYQVDSLQQRVIHLENQILVKKGNLNMLSENKIKPVKVPSNSQQG